MRIDAVEIIKERLTMRDVLERYGFDTRNRIACPIHNGTDKNFDHKGHSWRCYSHCGSGDEISFVQKLYGLSFQEALRKIDEDFSLNIYTDRSFEELRQIQYKQKAAKAKRDREEREKQKKENDYWSTFDEWKRLDDNRKLYRPKGPDEELHPLFVESLQKLDYQRYVLECANERRLL